MCWNIFFLCEEKNGKIENKQVKIVQNVCAIIFKKQKKKTSDDKTWSLHYNNKIA